MSYVSIVDQDGTTLAEYEKVRAVLGPDLADGHLVHAVGTTATGLRFVDIWESQAHADRFASEQLMPAMAEVLDVVPQPTAMAPLDLDVCVIREG